MDDVAMPDPGTTPLLLDASLPLRGPLAAVLLLAVASCGGENGPTEPDPDPDPPPAPATGAVEITTATSGEDADPDGYTVTVDGDGEERAIGLADTLVVSDLEGGDHDVEISNLAENCLLLEAENPRTVTVAAGDTASAHFAVACEGRAALQVTTATVAGGLDGDGFLVAVDGGDPRAIGTDGTETFGGLASGEHTLELSGLATGCFVDGGNPRQVTTPADETTTAALDVVCGLRDRIVFSSDRDGDYDLWVMGTDGSNPISLFGRDGSDGDAVVSPDGSLVAFASERAPGVDVFDIWVVEADGSNPVNLTPGEEGSDSSPAFSPDGSRLAFNSTRDGGDSDIYVTAVDGSSGADRLTVHAGSDFDPVWSPDGSQIAFVSSRTGDGDIHLMASDGSGAPERLTQTAAFEYELTWSPDGSRIAFRSTAGGQSDIDKVCVNGLTLPALTDDEFSDSDPAWSPDGANIVFTSDRDGDFVGDVWVMTTAGSERNNLSTDPAYDRDPAWSPQSGSGPGPLPGPSGECQVAAP